MKFRFLAAVFGLLWPALALAQSSPGLTYGQVPTAGQWNGYFAAKQDTLGYTPVNRAGDTMSGPLRTFAPIGTGAGLIIVPGLVPTAPADGSIWTTNSGLFARINGATVGPLGPGTIGGPGATTVGNIATWGNSTGTSLLDGGLGLPSSAIVGVSDTQTLTNKSISASQVNSGTLAAARMPALTGDVTSSAGSAATTIAAGAVTSAKMATGAAVANIGFTPLNPANNLSEVASAPTAWTNLGGGSIGKLSTVSLTANVSGTLPVGNGGTGATTLTSNGILVGNGTAAVGATAAMTNGQLLVGQTSSAPLPKTVSGDATMAASGALTVTKINGAPVGTAAGNIVALDGSGRYPAADGSQITNISGVWPLGTLSGLTLSSASTTTVGIAPGVCANEDGGVPRNMTLASAITKGLGTWAAGSGNGGLDTGTITASTWYHVHLIRKDSDGSLDALLSLSPTAPSMPTGYTARRRLGAVRTNGSSQVTAFSQVGDKFTWDVPIVDVSVTNPGTAAVTRTVTVPIGIVVDADLVVAVAPQSGTSAAAWLSPLAISDTAVQDPATATLALPFSVTGLTPGYWTTAAVRITTNTSAQIRSRMSYSSASTRLGIVTMGWIDTRGKN